MKYRKKPIVIEAEQWFPGKDIKGVIYGSHTDAFIETLEGDMKVLDGDWVITGIMGEKYACRPDIFEATYEKVE